MTTDQEKIAAFLDGKHLCAGLGTRDEPCSIAAINLALTGRLTDEIPDCMSNVVGRWIIVVQDAMPDAMRNSQEWRELLPLAAGTGREKERERLQIIMNWLWQTVLPTVQPLADKQGFGVEWRAMCAARTADAADAAARAARAARAADAADDPVYIAARAAADAAASAAYAAASAAYAAANATANAAARAADAAYWQTVNPVALLRELAE